MILQLKLLWSSAWAHVKFHAHVALLEAKQSNQVVIYWVMCFPEVAYKVGEEKKEQK